MASMSAYGIGDQPTGAAPPGYEWDPVQRAYVAKPKQAPTVINQKTGQISTITPQYHTDVATGAVDRFNSSTGQWEMVGGAGSGSGSASRSTSAAGSGGTDTDPNAARRTADYQALANEIRSQTGYTPVAAPQFDDSGVNAFNPAAESAAYGEAKERAALNTKAGMRSLREAMASRGIGGSGIEGGEMEKLYAAGQSDVAQADRDYIKQEAAAQYNADEALRERKMQETEFGANFAADQAQRQRDAQALKLSQLLSVYGSMYR